jgi:polysaccharide pyruvyl transferase WcaK-like protein
MKIGIHCGIEFDKIDDYKISDWAKVSGNNTGNLIFQKSSFELFEDSEVISVPYGKTPEGINRLGLDLFIVPAANWISNYYKAWGYWENIVNNVKCKIIFFGLGIQAVSSTREINIDTKQIVRVLQKFGTIGVRGHVTEEYLGAIGIKNVLVCGCPSLIKISESSINLLKNKIQKTNYKHLAINGYESIKDFVNYKSYEFFEQSNFENRKNMFIDVEKWGKKLQQLDCSVGTRIHGNILAIKYGTPALVYPKDLRIKELVEHHKIPNTIISSNIDLNESLNEKSYESFFKNINGTAFRFNQLFYMNDIDIKIRI